MSRHRYGLQLFSVSDVSLVRTRAGWRVTNVSPIDSLLARHKNKSREHALILRVMSLVRRFVVGEEKGGALFNVVWNGLSFLDTHELQPETSRWFEALFVLRILNVLGYVRHDDQYSLHLSEINTFTKESVESFASIYKVAIAEINRAIEASQL
jgi:recombinational DNA repair protein (RecF pathway)